MRLDEQLENYATTSEVAKMAREANDEIKALQRQLDAAFAENRALRALARPSRDDVIDAIGSLELRAANLRDMAGAGPAWLPVSEEKLARAKHYDDVAARFRALLSSEGRSND